MKFAAAVLLAVVFFADDAEAKRSKKKPRGRRGDKRVCKYVEDADDKTSDRFVVALSQRKSRDTDTPNTNPIKIGGAAKNFDATDGDTLTLNSFDTAGCAGTPKVIKDDISAKERTKRDGTTVMGARFGRSKDDTGAELSSFASFQLVGADGTQLMCCDTVDPSARMLADMDFILN